MKVTRLDLDGAGTPAGLVTKILAVERDLPIPVPIEKLSAQLDINEIGELTTEGFEGGLITDEVRSVGGILVRKGVHRHRRRYTIGHELGHFLLPFHRPVKPGQFLCSREDMRRWTAVEKDRHARMEMEANQFSALILMPPPRLISFLGCWREPGLAAVLAISEEFEVSKEAAARAYVQYQGQPIAIVVVKDATMLRAYTSIKFPRLGVRRDQRLPRASAYFKGASGSRVTSMSEVGAEHWLESTWGKRMPDLSEEVLFQRDGFAMVLLWAELPDDDDEDDDPEERLTSKERLRDRIAKSTW